MATRHRQDPAGSVRDPRVAIAELAVPEGFKAELIDGEIILSPSPPRLHARLIRAIEAQLLAGHDGWECSLEQTIEHPKFPDLPQPDLALVPFSDDAAEDGTWWPAEEVLLAVEVLSHSNSTNDTVAKPRLYARFGIPLYLIVDPFGGQCTLYAKPREGQYEDKIAFPFGAPVALPAPVAVELDTTRFRTFVPRA
ncbi:Uma2 family endonuclease [Actinocorallia sp. API 0066]|uniref:Uma2 family endonuclease n=1 Tax=Actinocorallia sp. API 0066 TaxID=2896846 RepID=UPI001E3DAB86|nr:Uma2 family endonuclease [Actinocorallia sp. API 0066]MCD0448993.1 Uma2 family endonuclease [Actinocorallia sp. API 0066]